MQIISPGKIDQAIPGTAMSGNPVTDNATLVAAGYVAGAIVSVVYNSPSASGLQVHPLDGANAWTGLTGGTGATGSTGATGGTGATGANGYTGATGSAGATGGLGYPGGAGGPGGPGGHPASGTGATGAQGPSGAVGATGALPEFPLGFMLEPIEQYSGTSSVVTALPVVRGLPTLNVSSALCADAITLYRVGVKVYTASGANAGKYTITPGSANTAGSVAVGVVTHTPTGAEPWLGVASYL